MQKKKLYIDVCTLCRPFDDQNIMRIRLETDAFYLILQSIREVYYNMVVSPVHLEEIHGIEDIRERLELITMLNTLGVNSSCNLRNVRERAEYFVSLKFGVADAAHLAFAEATADVFITCDDRLLKKSKRNNTKIQSVSPLEFCAMEDLK